MSRSYLLRMVVLGAVLGLTACVPNLATSPLSTPVSPLPTFTPLPSPTWTPTVKPSPTPTETPMPTPTETPVPTPVPLYTNGVWECWDRGQSAPCPYDASLSLKQMAFVSDTEAWAVGGNGYIARWDGYIWTRVESPTDKDLNDVAFLAPDNGWAVGEGGLILHWDGNAWTVVREYQPPLLGSGNFLIWNAVGFSFPDDGWVVGYESSEGGSAGHIMHWNGEIWEELSEEAFPYFPYYTSPPFILDVFAFSPQDAWAVGETRSSGGLILHWNGILWQEVPNPTHSVRFGRHWLLSISGLSRDSIWIGGWYEGEPLRERDGVVLRWDGIAWDEMRLGEAGWINTILMISEDNGWVGGDRLFHWNGQKWEQATKPVLDRIVDIKSSPNGKIWALTQGGAFLHLAVKEDAR